VNSCNYDDTGQLIASVGCDSTLRLWHKDARECVFLLRLKKAASSIRFLRGDVHYLITCSEEGVHLWDIRRHPTYAQFIEHSVNEQSSSKPDESFPFGKSGINMESMSWLGSTTPIPDKKAVPWDLPLASFHESNKSTKSYFDKFTKTWKLPFTGHSGTVFSAIPMRDGLHIITSATDSRHKLWDIYKQTGLTTFFAEGCDLSNRTRPCMSSQDSWLVSGSTNGWLHFWPIIPERKRRTCFYGKCKAVSQFSEGEESGNFNQAYQLHGYPITALSVNSDDSVIASGDESGAIKISSLYRPDTGQV
jgi:WD40 repeat protein